ncbi:hypothetical protein [Marivita geojedonensis]|uniref:hypothetical protein n=1 Tax=Marivita geojedonensis TaxID=1123756 RepID=UPI000D4CD79B|nr:hypothetical protein [Marivita geojedonensis]PRY73874.1 hypothetical protein CLV76_12753 [Marivita geojedonensis]
MKKSLMSAAAVIALSSTSVWAAGDAASAMEIARAQEACGEDRAILSARWLDDGRIGVTCNAGAGWLGGGGAAAAGGAVATNFVPIAGGLFAVVLGAAALGNNSSTSDTR